MKQICSALAVFLTMAAQQARAYEEQPQAKSECEKALESCKAASLNVIPSKDVESLNSVCEVCNNKCRKAKEVCKAEVQKNKNEMENFESVNVHHLNCSNTCQKLSSHK